ncbi:hypothetical protein OG21DRAFT_1480797 [Imleria badia]|nr:hypothetical protein OG21DRAFT_1480797 [Imleria badia]
MASHTPDKRRSRSEIHEEFPKYHFEDDFTEEDVLWKLKYREVHGDVVERGRRALDAIFDKDEEQVISITSHGGLLDALLSFVKHRGWSLLAGGKSQWLPIFVQMD